MNLPVGNGRSPRAFTESLWRNEVRSDEQAEALSRSAFLFMRGGLTPDESLVAALRGMDLDVANAERPANWQTIHPIAMAWSPPARDRSGSVREQAIMLAAMAEDLAAEELREPGNRTKAEQALTDAAPTAEAAAAAIKEYRIMVGSHHKSITEQAQSEAGETAPSDGTENNQIDWYPDPLSLDDLG